MNPCGETHYLDRSDSTPTSVPTMRITGSPNAIRFALLASVAALVILGCSSSGAESPSTTTDDAGVAYVPNPAADETIRAWMDVDLGGNRNRFEFAMSAVRDAYGRYTSQTLYSCLGFYQSADYLGMIISGFDMPSGEFRDAMETLVSDIEELTGICQQYHTDQPDELRTGSTPPSALDQMVALESTIANDWSVALGYVDGLCSSVEPPAVWECLRWLDV